MTRPGKAIQRRERWSTSTSAKSFTGCQQNLKLDKSWQKWPNHFQNLLKISRSHDHMFQIPNSADLLFADNLLLYPSCWTSPGCGQHSSLSSVWMVSFPFVLIQQKHYCSRGRRQKDGPLIIRFSFWRLPPSFLGFYHDLFQDVSSSPFAFKIPENAQVPVFLTKIL